MLQKIHENDQISWACSAQEPKMLPKRNKTQSSTKAALQASVARVWPEALAKSPPGKKPVV